MNRTELNRLISMLREHKESADLDSRSKGLLGNILGELKGLEKGTVVEVEQTKAEVKEILRLWKTDPVIQAYLFQKQQLEQRVRELQWQLDQDDPLDTY
jgi:hypothetical protein